MHNAITVAGIDVGKDHLDVVRQAETALHRRFNNTAAGHRVLIKWLRHAGQPVRVVVEASGIYSLDLALALHDADGIEVMLTNPRALKDYRRASMRRSKTDKIDAEIICDYAARMPFVPWQPPVGEVLELQQIARRIQALVVERTRETNRLHVAQSTYTSCAVVINDIEVNIRHLERRIAELEKHALRLIASAPAIATPFARLTSVRGIANRSAIQLLAEILVLPQGLSVRQWVASAGLDVRRYESGSMDFPRFDGHEVKHHTASVHTLLDSDSPVLNEAVHYCSSADNLGWHESPLPDWQRPVGSPLLRS